MAACKSVNSLEIKKCELDERKKKKQEGAVCALMDWLEAESRG
jgi:hypothetical protein